MVGDMVRLRENWRDWKTNEIAIIVRTINTSSLQHVILNNENKHDCHNLCVYQIEPYIKTENNSLGGFFSEKDLCSCDSFSSGDADFISRSS